ncbi:MAG: alpha/beta fold hydrolase [Anaerolineae bacterium]|nr:alpha/beta fold hydrolase [Anaerolineae bacterium]
MREETFRFGMNQGMVGIITMPEKPVTAPPILLLNAGMTHRVGPSRIYVRLARRLAGQGFRVMRFDFSGVGDSCVREDNLSLEKALVDDVRQALDYLEQKLHEHRFILAGHCGGAWISFLAASEDDRVIGAVLMNPEGADGDWVEYDRQRKLSRFYENYYGKEALLDPQRWKKLFTGKADYRSIFNNVARNIVMNRVSTVTFRLRNRLNPDIAATKQATATSGRWDGVASAFVQRQIRLLLAFSKGSSAIEHAHVMIGKELDTMAAAGIVTEVIIPNADHTFTLQAGQQALFTEIETWCRAFVTSAAAA